MARDLQIVIDYVPDEPDAVSVCEIGDQISVELPNTEIYLYPATARALRNALIEELGPPDGYVKEE